MPFSVEASAPGKLILFGEHAVVHGAVAVAGALSDLRIFCRVEAEEDGVSAPSLRITIPNIAHGAPKHSEYTHSWPLEQLRAGVGSHLAELCAAAGPSYLHPVNPTPATLTTLSALLEPCDAPQRKGLMPPLFLACTMLRTALQLVEGGSDVISNKTSLHLRIYKATLPVAAGLGSSASFSVSAAAALLETAARLDGSAEAKGLLLEGRKPGSAAGEEGQVPCERFLALLNKWSYASECLFHGNPSGLDNTVATYGGAIAYRKDVPPPSVAGCTCPTSSSTSSGPLMEPIAGMPALRIVVTNTHVPKETSKLVGGVKVLKSLFPSVMDPILLSIDGVSKSVLKAIADATTTTTTDDDSNNSNKKAQLYASLCRLIRMNHSLLNAIGVGHEALDRVAKRSSALGFSTKLTGAGGGGCALTLLPDTANIEGHAFSINAELGQQPIAPIAARQAESGDHGDEAKGKDLSERVRRFAEEMRSYGWDCFETRLGGCGVLLH